MELRRLYVHQTHIRCVAVSSTPRIHSSRNQDLEMVNSPNDPLSIDYFPIAATLSSAHLEGSISKRGMLLSRGIINRDMMITGVIDPDYGAG